MAWKVALLGIYHESNTFMGTPTTLQDFRNNCLLRGEAVLTAYRTAFHEIGGMIEVMEQHPDVELLPLYYAAATPGGVITADTYAALLEEMMAALDAAMPVDACLVVPHGAGVSEAFPDMDGHWLTALRQKLGPQVPIIGTLDPHANLSPAMASATDALVAYSTNPHTDQRETGRKAAQLLLQYLQGKVKPVQRLAMAPLAISIEQQYTAAEPCLSLYALAAAIGREQGILSVSVILGFPYADVQEMGTAFIVVANGNEEQAAAAGERLVTYLMQNRALFKGLLQPVQQLLPQLAAAAKPVLLLDMGDNVGGGAPGNSVVLLDALEADGRFRSFTCIYDPAAVEEASRHNAGDTFPLSFGDRPGNPQGGPFTAQVTLERLADGRFTETEPRHGGQAHFDMGRTAIVRTPAGNTVMLISLRIPPFSLQQLIACNVRPAAFDVIVAKGVHAPVAAYGEVCPTIMRADTPGITQANMLLFRYQHRRRPLFPFELT